jgi:hypothetical protein
MHAGISMLLSNPLTGVGMDSYDDWYRLERGLISAVRTGLGRTANSAHNITLDVASGGGFPLLLCYLALLVAILFAFFRGLRRGFAKNPIFLAASMSWIAYQVQAAVSINQIGVGVWGWILGGILLGIAKSDNTAEVKSSAKDKVNKESQKTLKKGSPNTPPPLPVISSFAILSLGFFISFLPFKADADFARATKSGSAELITEISERPAVNAFILSKSAADSLQSNVLELSKEIISKLVTSYPRNISGWMLMMQHPNFTLADRDKALEAIGKIDPYLRFCYSPNAVDQFREALNELPAEEKYKLARGWGLAPSLSPESIAKFTFSQVGEGSYEERLQSICGY